MLEHGRRAKGGRASHPGSRPVPPPPPQPGAVGEALARQPPHLQVDHSICLLVLLSGCRRGDVGEPGVAGVVFARREGGLSCLCKAIITSADPHSRTSQPSSSGLSPALTPGLCGSWEGGKEMVSSYAYFIHRIVQGPNVMSPPPPRPVKFLCWNPAPVGCTRSWGLWEVIRFR